MPRQIKYYGWSKQAPDHRDKKLPEPLMAVALPKSYDMRAQASKPWDQGSIGSCVGHSVASLFQFTESEQRGSMTDTPSRLMAYRNARFLMGTVNEDSGATIRDGMKGLAKFGVCRESDWPYKVTKFRESPPKSALKQALVKAITDYSLVCDDNDSASMKAKKLKTQLANNNPIAFGFSVPESFESDELAETGIMKMPSANEGIIGGHAVALFGYDDHKVWDEGHEPGMYLVRNSWGPEWGEAGYYWMPYKMVHDVDWCSDFWTLSRVP